MPAPSLFPVVVISLLAGVAARALVGAHRSPFASLVVGVLGAVLGGAVAALLALPLKGFAPVAAAAFAGAASLAAVVRLAFRR